MSRGDGDDGDPRADRRERRKRAERERMPKHGARTGEAYRNAVLKRLREAAGGTRRRGRRRR
jgi:hypothetical protein